jgi:hypothetical protein
VKCKTGNCFNVGQICCSQLRRIGLRAASHHASTRRIGPGLRAWHHVLAIISVYLSFTNIVNLLALRGLPLRETCALGLVSVHNV